MLKGIDPRLNAELLGVLRAMGHGDMIVLGDANFPASSIARHTAHARLLTMENIGLPEATEAVLSVFPLDTFTDDCAACMEVVGAPGETPEVIAQTQAAVDAAEGRHRPIQKVERFAFYDLARQAYAVVSTGEPRAYGNVMLRKGVVL